MRKNAYRTPSQICSDNRQSAEWLRDQIESLADSHLTDHEARCALRVVVVGVEWQLGTWR